jgi:hypothetical protein
MSCTHFAEVGLQWCRMVDLGLDEVVIVFDPIIQVTPKAYPTVKEPLLEHALTTKIPYALRISTFTTEIALACLGYVVEWLVGDGLDDTVPPGSTASPDGHGPSQIAFHDIFMLALLSK